MIEKVNPSHPDKIADRIAGAIVDLAYWKKENPKIACEVLVGHHECNIIIESDVDFIYDEISRIVNRIAGDIAIYFTVFPQDEILAKNQFDKFRCGDNGIFKGVPINEEEKKLSEIAHQIYKRYKSDGKYILDKDRLIVCQSNALREELEEDLKDLNITKTINPLGKWKGGIEVDTGATNRKLGSDMGRAITGGGLHGKDLSKADVSVNIYAYLKAQETGQEINICCGIGDEEIDGKSYSEIVEIARKYIESKGGFEVFAEWGLF